MELKEREAWEIPPSSPRAAPLDHASVRPTRASYPASTVSVHPSHYSHFAEATVAAEVVTAHAPNVAAAAVGTAPGSRTAAETDPTAAVPIVVAVTAASSRPVFVMPVAVQQQRQQHVQRE